jgi:chemotaxis protein CheD
MPLSKMNVQKAEKCPHMFVDTGVASLLEAVLAKGGRKKDLVVCAAGACRLLDETQAFNIGERNYTVLRKILWKNRIMIAAEEVGGMTPRTILLRIDSGRTFIRSGGEERELRAAESGNRAARIAIPATGTDRT